MNSAQGQPIEAILFDLDGVLYIGDNPIEGAVEAVRMIRELGLSVAGLTNTTTQPKRAVAEKLNRLGIDLNAEDIYTPAALAVQAIGSGSARLYVRDSLLEDFQGVAIRAEQPDYIVMGDLGGAGYTPELMHEIFNAVMDGAEILALHKNRFWQKPDGLHLDIGPFIAAIEYATGTQTTVLGKPSAACFHGVCSALHVKPAHALMIGDDIESDIGGAKAAGLKTILVQTGKYRAEFVASTGIQADRVIPSIADLRQAMELL